MKRHSSLVLAAALLLAGGHAARADDASDTALARLKTAYQNVVGQLRTVTADDQTQQAMVADLQSQRDTLTAQVSDLTKKAAAQQDADTKEIAVLKAEKSDQEDSIAKLQQALDEWKAAQQKAATAATETEAKRAKLADLAIHLQRMVDDQKRRNDQMYKIGMEILDRYEKFGLGEALTAKEPFVGITRTKFETLVQDYEDKLVDQTITSPAPPSQTAPGVKPRQ
jgi:chromosome segregation ATPase